MRATCTALVLLTIIIAAPSAYATVIQFDRAGAMAVVDAASRNNTPKPQDRQSGSTDAHRYRALTEAVALRHAGADGVAAAGLDAVGFALLFSALVNQESRFDPAAVSPKGAQGLGQLMPATAAALGVTDPFDPEANLDGAARYFVQQLAAFRDVTLALAAYNAGPQRVIQYGGVPPFAETRAYVAAISHEAGLGALTAPPTRSETNPAGSTPPPPSPTGADDGARQRSPSVWQF